MNKVHHRAFLEVYGALERPSLNLHRIVTAQAHRKQILFSFFGFLCYETSLEAYRALKQPLINPGSREL